MKNELPAPALIGTAVLVVVLLIGMVYLFLRPEPIPEGKIDPTLPPPQAKAGETSRYGAGMDNTGQPPPAQATISKPSGD